MADRTNYSSGAPWEARVGYSRAVRVGGLVFVTGTVASREGQPVGEGDMYLQARTCLEIIGEYLVKAGASYADVVRTRMFVTDIERWEAVAQAHREVFAGINPCTTLVEVSRLIAPEYLIEIEADAVVG
ncbi:MAG: RidA family protein [Bacteroidia bacterium]|nr:RidA family protein [Bacteroidia bacterium]